VRLSSRCLFLCLMLWSLLVTAETTDFSTLLKGAAAGDAYAQLNLGAAYDNGIGVKRDLDKALYWYQQAAEQGVAEAQYNLAHLLVAEELSATVAAEWMLKAAEQGLSDAEYLMGVIYAEGIGVEVNDQEAKQWLQRAVKSDSAEAKAFLQQHYGVGEP
jgi:TPR repeat protein